MASKGSKKGAKKGAKPVPKESEAKTLAPRPKRGVTTVMSTDSELSKRPMVRPADGEESMVRSRDAIQRRLMLWSGGTTAKRPPSIGSMQPDFKKR